ncbi:hypothetical protein DICPUDRAFT_148914 [Dictyostelium purpureum]|uniref:Uncharacterized protein n=1 Tax=Dictyostelium purpureum TaxID=5786 RepID=F0ZCB7_DICPU|nr:uncharacterized protein DICPUDRAFT_148914 [Dictyostelium purpureum]EGC38418.1 hypothetical protein DICPUDRAFT_148914 [Dictyostelium purpureum]|eukprot:XP_003285079.1 hypothetical protein DICPUDRAFT_148914 [Dictyostelium purpureum]
MNSLQERIKIIKHAITISKIFNYSSMFEGLSALPFSCKSSYRKYSINWNRLIFQQSPNRYSWKKGFISVIKDYKVTNVKIQIILSNTLVIGSFSAASNASGILEDTIAATELLKQYNALISWDYACAASYIYKPDPIFLLHHNFISSLLNDLFGT